jgi:uridine phosphorylase
MRATRYHINAITKLITLLVWVFFASPGLAGSIGFYAGSFDPPTAAQVRFIRCALGGSIATASCPDQIPRISGLVISLDDDPQNDPLTSTRERVLMLNKALQEYGTRVAIVAANRAKKEGGQLPPAGAVELTDMVSRSVRQNSEEAVEERSIDSEVNEVIGRLGLYQDVTNNLSDLQRSLFDEGWKDFLKDLELVCPTLMTAQNCAELSRRWNAIRIVTDEQEPGADRLVYKRAQSEGRWAEKFSAAAVGTMQESDRKMFRPVADDIAARVFQGYPYGKLPHLKRVSLESTSPSGEPPVVIETPMACAAPEGSYYMDMDQYVADRFPRAFAAFLRDETHKGHLAPTDLYVHAQAVDEAFEFHRRDQFVTFYQLQTRRGQLYRNVYLAVRAQPLAYRVVLTDVRGHDRKNNVLCQIYWTKVFSSYHAIDSHEPKPLFILNSTGNSLELSPKDWLVIGFKGNWTRKLLAEGWRQTPLVDNGLDIDLFTHLTDGRRIIVARNVYGDDAAVILEAFYKQGARRVIYLGTAGAIADYQIGDVVIPNKFVDLTEKIVPFHKNLAHNYAAKLSELVVLHAKEKHASVRTIFDETTNTLNNWRANSVGSVDIEGIHLATFAAGYSDLNMAILFIVSDQTLGAHTIEQSNAHRRLIDQSVDKLLSVLLSKPEILKKDKREDELWKE